MNLKDKIRKKLMESKARRARKKSERAVLKQQERARSYKAKQEYRQTIQDEKVKQQLRYAREREKIKTDAKLNRTKQYYKQGGFLGAISRTAAASSKRPVKRIKQTRGRSIKRKPVHREQPLNFDKMFGGFY